MYVCSYRDMKPTTVIVLCLGKVSLSCQASYWSSKKYQVHGDVFNGEGEKVRHLFGTWHEAMYCGEEEGDASCVWQAGMVDCSIGQWDTRPIA